VQRQREDRKERERRWEGEVHVDSGRESRRDKGTWGKVN